MSGAKDLLARQEQQYDVATQIAVESGVLKFCEYHGIAYDSGNEHTPAYKLGNWKLTNGKFGDLFADSRELGESIKHAIDDHPAESCPRCELDA
jgi:hypothetical protein